MREGQSENREEKKEKRQQQQQQLKYSTTQYFIAKYSLFTESTSEYNLKTQLG